MGQGLHLKKIFLITLIISMTISALIGIVIFLLGNFGNTEEKLILTTLAIGGYSMAGLGCSFLYEKRSYNPLSLIGMIASAIGLLLTILVIWEAVDFDDTWKAVIILAVLSFGIAHMCLLLLIKPVKSLVSFALSATLIFIGIVSFMLIILILNDFSGLDSFYFRLLGAFAILDALGTITTPILNKVYLTHH